MMSLQSNRHDRRYPVGYLQGRSKHREDREKERDFSSQPEKSKNQKESVLGRTTGFLFFNKIPSRLICLRIFRYSIMYILPRPAGPQSRPIRNFLVQTKQNLADNLLCWLDDWLLGSWGYIWIWSLSLYSCCRISSGVRLASNDILDISHTW